MRNIMETRQIYYKEEFGDEWYYNDENKTTLYEKKTKI